MRHILVSWAAAWPTITVLLLLTNGTIDHMPLAIRTLILSGLMVPLMALVLVPALTAVIKHLEMRNRQS